MRKQFLVGSAYFFKDDKSFKPKDRDYVVLVDNPKGFENVRQTINGSHCLFEWRKMPASEFIDYALRKGPAMQVGKFLVPEFANEIGLTINDLQRLSPLVVRLDGKHEYERLIFNYYIQNGKFELTTEQLAAVRAAYDQARQRNVDNLKGGKKS